VRHGLECLLRVNFRHRASRPPRRDLLRYRTPTRPTADLRQAVAAINGRPRHAGDRCSPVTGRQGGRPWCLQRAINGPEQAQQGSSEKGVAFTVPRRLPDQRKSRCYVAVIRRVDRKALGQTFKGDADA